MAAENLKARLAGLPPEQRALLAQRLRARHTPRTCELSVTQQGLWLIDQLSPRDPLYTLGWRITLAGPLNTDTLTSALNAVVARHDALRTTFAVEDGRPVQIVAPAVALTVPVDDFRDASAADVAAACAAEVEVGFDLATGPLIRARLLRVAAEEHVLTLLVHHIVFDALSFDVVLRELAVAYEALDDGRTVGLGPVTQYPDFARWQREHLSGDRLTRLVDHWRDQLDGAPDLLTLPTRGPRPGTQSHAGAEFRTRLPAGLSDRVRALARAERATVVMVLLAAFQVLLMRHSGQQDVSVGMSVGGRTRGEFQDTVGYFVTMLVLRAGMADNPSFREHLRRTRSTCLAAFDHQNLPFDRLVEHLRPPRSLGHNPLFQVVFESHSEADQLVEFGGVKTVAVDVIDLGRSKFDLNVSAVENGPEIDITVEYATDLFDATGIAAMTGHLRRLLESAVADPDEPVGTLEMLTEAERQVLLRWQRTTAVSVLDEHEDLAPAGVVGELHEGEAATGYLARWDHHGTLHVLGRRDEFLALRGARIDPAEVESALAACPGVARAAVAVSDGLVGYVVPANGFLDVQGLRAHVGGLLPAHLVPARIVVVADIPRAPNGRPDRAALAAKAVRAEPARTVVTPREVVLRGLFAEVLGVESVGLDEDFFDLGGHSMLAARLIRRVADVFGAEMSLRTLFEAPSVALLATVLDRGAPGGELDVLLPLRTGGDRTPIFCVHPAFGLGWSYTGLLRHLDAGHPVYAVQSPGLAGDAADVPVSVPDMASLYVDRIRDVAPDGRHHLLGWSAGGLIAHEMAVRLQSRGERVGMLAVLDGYPLAGWADRLPSVEAEAESEIAGVPVADALRPKLLSVFTAVTRAVQRFTPGHFDGDLVHFRSSSQAGTPFTADLWRPHIRGSVRGHEIAHPHQELTGAAALAEIGPVLAGRLAGEGKGDTW